MSFEKDIEEAVALVDSYHGMPHPAELRALYMVRRDLAAVGMRLATHTKATYGKRQLSYTYRKYAIAREIAKALDDDATKIKSERRPFNQVEVKTESLDQVLQLRKAEAETEGDWEQLRSVKDSVEEVLKAIGQEITDGRREQDYQNHLEVIRLRDQQRNGAEQQ